MAATTADMAVLAADTIFLGRVKAELAIQCANISSETITGLTGTMPLALHVRRAQFVTQILQSLAGSGTPNWPLIFTIAVSTDTTVINQATTNGTVAANQTLVTDVNIGNAIAAQFNGFLQPT